MSVSGNLHLCYSNLLACQRLPHVPSVPPTTTGGDEMTTDSAETAERFDMREAAGILGVTTWTLGRWIRNGHIGHLRVGGRVFFTQDHIAEFWRRAERPAWVQPELPFEAEPP